MTLLHFLNRGPSADGYILAVILVFVFAKIIKPKYGLFLFTTAREQQVFTSMNINDIRAIESALQQAIAMRG